MRSLGHPRAALLGFAAAVLAYNVLALLQRAVEQAQQPPPAAPTNIPLSPPLEVSCFHLAVQVRSGYEGLLIALPPEHWPRWDRADPVGLAHRLLRLARNINPHQVATSKRGPKTAKPKGYVDAKPRAPKSQPHGCSQQPREHPERVASQSMQDVSIPSSAIEDRYKIL